MRLVAYESQQSASQTAMQQEVKNQVGEVTEGLKALYTVADLAIGAVASRVQRIEEELIAQGEREKRRNERGGGEDRTGPRSLLYYKNMKVPVLDKPDGWRNWLADVEDYTEETMPSRATRKSRIWTCPQARGISARWCGVFLNNTQGGRPRRL